MSAKEWIDVGILACLVATLIWTVRSFNATREWFKKDMRPWMNATEINTHFHKDSMEFKPVIRNVGKTPAFIRFTAKLTIGAESKETPHEREIGTILPGQIYRTTMWVIGESFPKVISGEKKLIMELDIEYSSSRDSMSDYKSRIKWEFNPKAIPKGLPADGGKFEGLGLWTVEDSDMI